MLMFHNIPYDIHIFYIEAYLERPMLNQWGWHLFFSQQYIFDADQGKLLGRTVARAAIHCTVQ